MKTLLVTGGLGFIGSNFVLQEIASGNKIINLDKVTYAADFNNLKEVANNQYYKFIKGDIANSSLIENIFSENKIDYVVNFAAESHVDNSIKNPLEFINTNIIGTYNLLQNSLKYFEKLSSTEKFNFRFLHVSTDEVFGSLSENSSKFDETTKYDPSSPYSASKAASDHLAKAWFKTYGLPIIITNCSNNYGPRQHKEKLIPKTIANCLEQKPIPIYGNGKNIRDWIYVENHAEGIKLALTKGKTGENYLFGGECEKNNLEVVNIICEIMDEVKPAKTSYKNLISFVEDRKGHDFRYAIDNKKSTMELGFKANNNFKENIKKTIEFYLA